MLVIFDLDDTLIDTSGSITPAKLEKVIDFLIEQGCDLKDRESALSYLRSLDAVSPSAKDALKVFMRGVGTDEKLYLGACKEVYETFPAAETVKPFEGTLELLSGLRGEAFLALVSIGKLEQQIFKLEKAGIDSSFFYKIFVSEKGEKKKYYELIIEELGLPSSEVIVCGDRIATDLVPAKELGCTTIYMKRGRGVIEQNLGRFVDFAVTSPPEIMSIFRKIKNKTIFNGVQSR